MKTEFKCSVCKQTKPIPVDGISTGYGYDKRNRKVCFVCCGERDKASMIKDGKACLYLSQADSNGKGDWLSTWTVGNWPGTMKLAAVVRKGSHNIARTRYDAWFTGPDNQQWHGVTYGDNTQICHCKRLKV